MDNFNDKTLYFIRWHKAPVMPETRKLEAYEEFYATYKEMVSKANLLFFENPSRVPVYIGNPGKGAVLYSIQADGMSNDYLGNRFNANVYDRYDKTREPVEVFVYRMFKVRIMVIQRGPGAYFFYSDIYRLDAETGEPYSKPLCCSDDLANPRSARKVAESMIDVYRESPLKGDDFLNG